MSEPVKNVTAPTDTRLANALREVKNALADRDDVVVDIREAQRTRLELLAEDLQPVFSEIPADDERFDLAISAGAQPRLWIDAVAHVAMARDKRSYRLVCDTRLGRVVLVESTDMKKVADHVTRYIAERVIERKRALEGLAPAASHSLHDDARAPRNAGGRAFLRGLGVLLLGGLVGASIVLLLAWQQGHLAVVGY